RAIDLDPKMGWSYINWAQMLRSQHRYTQAIEKLSPAVNTTVAAQAYALWGDILVEMNEFDEAHDKYQRADQKDKKLAHGPAGEAFLLRRKRRYHEAILASAEAIARDRNHPAALGGLAEALRLIRQFDTSRKTYEELILLDPYQSGAYVGVGLTLRA